MPGAGYARPIRAAIERGVSSASERLSMQSLARAARGTPLIVEADDTTWRTLALFCVYRIVMSMLVGIAYLYLNRFFNLGVTRPQVVLPTIVAYSVASLVLLVPARLREPNLTIQVTA